METDLLLKEDEFYKANQQIELRTKQLMQQVNDVMKIQDNLIIDTFNTRAEISNIRKNPYPSTKEKEIIADPFFDRELAGNVKDISDGTNSNAIIRVYKMKIKNLVTEKERVQIELKHKCEELKKLQKENHSLKEEKEKWFLVYNTAKNNSGKLEGQITNLNARLQLRENENSCLKKEVEQLKKELKSCTANLNNNEMRFSRLCEENEKLKDSTRHLREEEKELKEGYRKQLTELTSSIKQLEKQKTELLNGFKKQMQLIDVLKKQKTHLETIKVTELAETEYLKILDWKFD